MSNDNEGNAVPVTVSFYRKQIDICNEAIVEAGFNNPSQFLRLLVEDWDKKRGTGLSKEFLMLIVEPFLIILFMLLYSFEAGILWLNIIGGVLASAFWYFAYRFSLELKGIDPRTHFKSKRKQKKQGEI